MKRAFAVLTFAITLAGCETLEETGGLPLGDAARGRVLAEKNCSGCHAVGETDTSPYAPAPPLRTIHTKYDVEGLAEAFAEGIGVGHKGEKQMPEFVLTPAEIDDLLAYLDSLE